VAAEGSDHEVAVGRQQLGADFQGRH
jgi:hypothetical protein